MARIDPEKLAALRVRIRTLTAVQQKRLRTQLEAQGIAWSEVCPEVDEVSTLALVEQSRPARLGLTPSQAHVWVLHQLFPNLCAYHIAFAWRLEGELDHAALENALTQIVARHESLRIVVRQEEGGEPYQTLLEPCAVKLDVVEASDTVVSQPFDLHKGPLYRMQWRRESEGVQVLVIVLHHLIADGWSRGVLMRDFAHFYRQHTGVESHSEMVRTDEALAQVGYSVFLGDKEWQQSREMADQLDYWKRQLKDFTLLELPADRPRPAQATFESKTLIRALPLELADGMKQLARSSGATLFMVLLAVFKVLLHRHTGRSDIAVGVPVAGRRYPECADLIGFFVNTLVLRTQFSSSNRAAFTEWIQQVKATVLEGLEHQFVPFSKVVEACAPRRNSHQNPLFEVMFQVQSDGYQTQNAAAPEVQLPGIEFTQSPLELPETKFDLTWHVFDRKEELLVAVEYRTALFDEARIDRLIRAFELLLVEVLRDPSQTVSTLPIMASGEREEVLQMGQGSQDDSETATFVEAFQRQVKLHPDEIAVRSEEEALTYRELDEKACELAGRLRALGVGPEVMVGIHLPRSTALLVALMAVMKSGGAYVPIDPALPGARRAFIRKDSACQVVIGVDEIEANTDIAMPNAKPSLGDACYVLYTSGSTGRPKGVVVNQGGLMHYLRWALETYPYEDGWGAPVQSGIGFDATITSLLAPLLVGQEVRLLPEENVIEALADALQEGASVVKVTPAHLAAVEPLLPESMVEESLPKSLVIGGEALTAAHIEFWRRHYPDVVLVNEYGPTETVVGCCVEVVDETTTRHGNLPIGRPIANTQLYVLDSHLEPLPVGVLGELYIAGGGVARGYLNQPALTAERFLPNPFASPGSKHGTVMYRSGDLAMFREDGVLEFLGRVDEQIQLRGYRIEPAEIEVVLRRQPTVAGCAVVVRGRSQLVAFVQAESDSGAALRDALSAELPAYMVPSVFQVVDSLPLTPNGKIDKNRLPEVELINESADPIAPRDAREESLFEVWRKVLGRDDLGVKDNFFERGGDSIMAMQIIAGARREGLKLTPAMLFEHQTIASLAKVAEELLDGQLATHEVTIGEIPLSPIQKAYLDLEQPEPGHFNQGVLLRLASDLDAARFAEAVRVVLAYHDAFRLRLEHQSGNWKQWIEEEGSDDSVAIKEIDLRRKGDNAARLNEAIEQCQTTFDLKAGPLIRVIRFFGASGEDRLLLLAHHFVVDGLSWRILLQDLEDVYTQLERGVETATLPPKTTSFGFWLKHLMGKESAVSESNKTLLFPGHHGGNRWETAETLEVRHHFPTENVTDVVLLTALIQTLGQFANVGEVSIDVEHHGRNAQGGEMDFTRTVGWFTAILSLTVTLPEAGLGSAIVAVKEQLESSVANAHLEHRDRRAQVSFNFLGNLYLPSGKLVLGMAPEPVPGLNSSRNVRPYVVEVVAWLLGGELKVLWRFNREVLSRETVASLAKRQVSAVESLLCASQPTKPKAVSTRLGKLMAKLESRGG